MNKSSWNSKEEDKNRKYELFNRFFFSCVGLYKVNNDIKSGRKKRYNILKIYIMNLTNYSESLIAILGRFE